MRREEGKQELRCINCGSGVRRLLVQYNPGNIRLMKCDNCKAVADPYIECEFMIVLIDLILHKQKAYRHVLFNVLSHDAVDAKDKLWKSGFIYFVLDTCRTLLLNRSKEDCGSSSSSLFSIGTLVKVLMVIFLGNFAFLFFILLATRILLNGPLNVNRYKGLLYGIFVSSYFKIFLIAMMVWEFPSSVIFIIDTFALSSNVVALKVLTQMPMTSCIGVCLGANGAKFLANPLLLPLSSGSLGNK